MPQSSRQQPLAPPPAPEGARLVEVSHQELPGWRDDELLSAFEAFLASCRALMVGNAALRDAVAAPEVLIGVCREAIARERHTPADIRAFFESRFTPYRIVPVEGRGFLTAYYEPEVQGSLTRRAADQVPLLGRPRDLVTFTRAEPRPPGFEALAAARRTDHGLEPFPDRAAIEDGALDGLNLERIYLPDAVDAFMVHVQGSARVRLDDGRVIRMTYAGRNGHPYTSIGRVIVAEGHMDLETMTLAKLKAWLRAHPDDARRIMRLNCSYIFFERNDEMQVDQGPIGGAGLPLTAHRSIAIDRSIWAYGLPFFLETELPQPDGSLTPTSRLMIAQDTGSAIVGPARADYFMGSGDEAGLRAGLVRQPMDLTVFWPRMP